MNPDIYTSHIIGPIHSRRLGVSLGVNLLPKNGKVCSFDCLYCECGYNADHRGGKMPSAEEVMVALEQKLKEMYEAKEPLDVITFAGNGEPTLHPQFAKVIDQTIALRNRYFPHVKVSVLSNATRLENDEVCEALKKVDNNILKLDGAWEQTIRLINQPVETSYSVKKVIDRMKQFEGGLIIQTMFVRGTHNQETVDNTTTEEVKAWCDIVLDIRPKQVMVYSLDRPTPETQLKRVPREELESIVEPLRKKGLDILVVG